MSMQTYGLTPQRLGRYKGHILKAAVAQECISRGGRQVSYPRNNSDTYVARRFIPYGATAAEPNRFFGTANGDRGQALVTANQVADGVTPTPDNIVPQDVSVVMQQYGCLYGFTDKTYNLYEDDIPAQMEQQIGERMTLVNEAIVFGALKASTNRFFGGTGTTRATVNGGITLPMLRRIARSLQANHGMMVTKILKPSADFGTDAVGKGFIVYCHTDLEPDIRDLSGFVPIEKYASGTPMENELGKVERFRFVTSPEFVSVLNGGVAIASAPGFQSTGGANIDVYQFIVTAQDAWSQVAVRGMESFNATFLPPNKTDKSDPLGQRGYAGATWWKAVMIENNGWMAVGEVGARTL
jgi:N4-gp56 family major capsid protein